MKIKTLCLSAAVGLCLALPAAAKSKKVYSGDEARAISCAHMIYMTGTLGYAEGYVSRRDAQAMQVYAIRILQMHTTGNTKQKVKAMKIMAERKTLAQTQHEFVTRTKSCIKRFPV